MYQNRDFSEKATYKIPEIHFLWDEGFEKRQIMAEKAYKNAMKHAFIGS